ncbi:hypothetical protein [Flammeovirga sp. EKP202]|uniref:hypothetical protein n=1 Tax=Flammeovirga sp. EKP202 TaxID=2770592 RepID=UPI00165FEA0E|nr:hypothetical protein [Flammeovirga sp. EKP202]MBD0400755.1 hypothetical protein [Flammeovirga sp. EKP202]
MVSKKLLLPFLLMVSLFASYNSQAQNFSSTFIEYAYGWNNTDYVTGANPQNGGMNLFTLDHTTVTKWGGVYGFVNYMGAPSGFYMTGFDNEIPDEGAANYRLYSEVSPWVSLSGVTGKDFSFGPVADVSIDGQLNFGNGFMAGLAGVGLTFKAPKGGFLKLSTYWRTDNIRHDAVQFTGVFDLPLWRKLGFRMQGFFDLIPNATNRAEFGSTDMGTDFISQTRFLFDVGRNTVFKNDKNTKLEFGVDIYMHFNKDLAANNSNAFVPQPCVRLTF